VRSVCVFCGSRPGTDPAWVDTGRRFGQRLAERGLTLVYGGGHVGMMGAVADGALDAGGDVIGVIPRGLVAREVAHPRVTQMDVVDSMHERKARFAELSDAFVALPGGIGTLEELFETWTWLQLGIHSKPVSLLDIGGYWSGLVGFLDHAVDSGFVGAPTRGDLIVDTDTDTLLDRLAAWTPRDVRPWLDASES